MAARMFMGFFFCIIAIAAHADSDNCILIFEGAYNEIMVAPKIPPSNEGGLTLQYNVWHTVDDLGVFGPATLMPEFDSQRYTIDEVGYSEISEMAMDNNCPTNSFTLHGIDGNTPRATVFVAKAPLNTLCRPNKGILKFYNSEKTLGTTNSLYECASKVVLRKDGARGVQWNIGTNGQCSAFYGGVRFELNDDQDSSLACVLQCNKLPIFNTFESRLIVRADNFTHCMNIGEDERSDHISYISSSSDCHLYHSTFGHTDQIVSAATFCHIPPKRLDNCVLWSDLNDDNSRLVPSQLNEWILYEGMTIVDSAVIRKINGRYLQPRFIHDAASSLVDYCPTEPFTLYEADGIQISVENVIPAKPPLNTLCMPYLGTITTAMAPKILERTDSLYECATQVLELKDGARGVQWNNDGSRVCKAFYGMDVSLSDEGTRLSDEGTGSSGSDAGSSLACVLQCNKHHFIGNPGTGTIGDAANFDACMNLGEIEGSHSISFDSQLSTCHLYDGPGEKLITIVAIGCYLPQKATTTTTTTTTTQKSTLSTAAKVAIGIVVGVIATAGIGAAVFFVCRK